MRFLLSKILSRVKSSPLPQIKNNDLQLKKKNPVPEINLYEYFKLEPKKRKDYKS